MECIRSGRLAIWYDQGKIKSRNFCSLAPRVFARQMAVVFILRPIWVIGGTVRLFRAGHVTDDTFVRSGQDIFIV